jgi:hypothetical protein
MIRRVLWAVIAAGLTVILANAVVLARRHDAAHDPLRPCATAADRICSACRCFTVARSSSRPERTMSAPCGARH